MLWGEWFTGWLAEGVRPEIDEWDLLADLDAGLHAGDEGD
jgi:hypothetical protein